ncbi:MAG: nucleoside deaminase [Pseudomonadota bacterium]
MLSEFDRQMIELSFLEAKISRDAGGLPIGSVLARGETILAAGHNQRVQKGDPIAHGEMDALRKAGRQATYADTTLYTSLSPCMMCSGTIVQFKIPRVVINDTQNFGGNETFLLERGVEVIDAAHDASIMQMAQFINDHPDLWNEDIAFPPR